MIFPPQDVHALVAEQHLLRAVVALVRRCDGPAPTSVLDAVLSGTAGVRPVLPRQRRPARR